MQNTTNIYQTASFAVISISYEKADAEIRGKFAFFEDQIKSFVRNLHEQKAGDAFVVSTCNRTEIYTTTNNYLRVAELYCECIGVRIMDFMQYAKVLKREDALIHLFRVAAGLESQILGDFEIIGQIKKAFNRFKKEKKNANPYLERAINSAIQISKRIKTETNISNGATSVAYAAVHYILNETKHLIDKNILLLGTGEIGQNTVENLLKHINEPKISLMNRTVESAEKLSNKYGIPHIAYEGFQKALQTTDILIVATAAPKPIVHASHLPKHKQMLVIDLSIPNNVEKKADELDNIKLLDVDGLSITISETLDQRKKEIPRANEIIKEMAKDFAEWEKKRKMAPRILHFKSVLQKMEQVQMHNIHKRHHYVDVNDMQLSEKMIQKITNRFAKYIIDNPGKADEVSALMHDIFVEQPNREFNEKHA